MSQRRHQVSSTPLDVILFSKEGLADTVSSRDRSQRKAEFDTGPAGSIIPDILSKELTSETAGESELRRICLTDSYPVKCAGHRVQQIRYEQPFKLMSAIGGGHQIEAVAINRAQKLGEPFGFDVRGLG